jgi:hypothetical protein
VGVVVAVSRSQKGEASAADAAGLGEGDRQSERYGNGAIKGVTAGAQHLHSDLGRARIGSRHHDPLADRRRLRGPERQREQKQDRRFARCK